MRSRFKKGPPLAMGLVAAAAAGHSGAAQTPPQLLGRWLTQKGDAVVEFYNCADKVCGKLVWIANPPRDGSEARDGKNPDETQRGRPLCGLTMLGGFSQRGPTEWKDGWIYSPDTGETFKASLTLAEPNVLKLRGYVGIPLFGQTQTWTRAEPGFPPCGQR